jgi:hypothetical protein
MHLASAAVQLPRVGIEQTVAEPDAHGASIRKHEGIGHDFACSRLHINAMRR